MIMLYQRDCYIYPLVKTIGSQFIFYSEQKHFP